MGKGQRHAKNLKSERAKVKLKAKKTKHLPKGLNVTDPTLKIKKIVIKEQLRQHDESEILSKRKLNVKELLSRLQHHNSTVRQEAIKQLKDMLYQHTSEVLSSQFGPLLQGICALSVDKEMNIRRDSLKVLSIILSSVSNQQLGPYCDVLISYLRCAMTHIDPRIKEDTLLYLDILVQHCGSILARNSHKILPNFLDMISKLHTETKPGRQLTTTLNSKNTTVKWRIKVLERLVSMFNSIANFLKFQKNNSSNAAPEVLYVFTCTKYIPLYPESSSQTCEIDFEQDDNLKDNAFEKTLSPEELMKYVELLMPLIFDSWIEVCPNDKNMENSEMLITGEATELLKSIVNIMQLIIECIETLQCDCDIDMKTWFKNNFENSFTKTLFSKFPYSKITTSTVHSMFGNKKRQGDFSVVESQNDCLGYNLGLCQIYVWFTSIRGNNKIIPRLNKNYCTAIIQYINDKLENWSIAHIPLLPQLIKLLKTLFLKASKVWYGNRIVLTTVLRSVVRACCSQSKRALQMQLFTVLSDIMLDHTLHELHGEDAFKVFVSTLPSLLLKPKIHENTIQMINRVALRYRRWIEEELIENQDAIIANAKRIEISGSEDVKRSRLTICNLFYFRDTQIFY